MPYIDPFYAAAKAVAKWFTKVFAKWTSTEPLVEVTVGFMKTTPFADTGIRVSALSLGCLPFGTKLDQTRSYQLLDAYLAQGGSFLDTANNYSFWEPGFQGGESETVLGRWFSERKNRHQVFLATKLGASPTVSREAFFAYSGNPWADLTEGLSAQAIVKAVEGSLRRLGTDHIDLLYAHVDDRRVDQEETLQALDGLVRSGKVRYLGSSNFKVWRLAQAQQLARSHGWSPFKAVQMFHTYYQSERGTATGMADPMGDELFDYVRSGEPLTLLGYTPLLWGSYTQPHKYQEIDRLQAFVRPQNTTRGERLRRVAAESGLTVNQVIYAWMLASDPVVIPLVAVSQLAHLHEDLASADVTLAPEHLRLLNESVN
jgi:aryl-alcohol dehydrogenase-like predicted oxidoreductase